MTSQIPTTAHEAALSNLMHEHRHVRPSPEFAAQANVTESAYATAAADQTAFWAEQASRLSWVKPWDQVLDWSDAPFAKWFVGGRLNVAVNGASPGFPDTGCVLVMPQFRHGCEVLRR